VSQGQKKLDLCLRLICVETQSCRHIHSSWITETFSSLNPVLAFYVLSQESIRALITNPDTCTWNVTAWKNENHLDWKKDFRVSKADTNMWIWQLMISDLRLLLVLVMKGIRIISLQLVLISRIHYFKTGLWRLIVWQSCHFKFQPRGIRSF
jgi:hypothetical protein